MDEVEAAEERRRLPLHAVPLVVLVVGLVLTAIGAATASSTHRDTEARLLHQRVTAASAVFASTLPSLASPLEGAAALADIRGADAPSVEAFLEPQVGEDARFGSVSVWPLRRADPEPVLVLGAQPGLASEPAEDVRAFLDRAEAAGDVAVVDLLEADPPSIGFGATGPGPDRRYAVYAENALPEDRHSQPQAGSAFEDVDYALYLGPDEDPAHLLVASDPELPLTGSTDRTTVPFGDAEFLLVMRAKGDLAGSLSARLPWLIAVIGSAFSIAFALLAEDLLRRRDGALRLAEDNRRLYHEQRTVADAVQHSLLPASLPEVEGLELEVRYRPGEAGTEVGGDWYDVVQLDDEHVLVVVGDVAGRGLRAATVMAMLRHAIRAYALQGDDPGDMVDKLTRLMGLDEDSGFATVLFLELDLAGRTATIVNAGHPRPLVVDGQRRFVEAPVGPPVGVPGNRAPGSARVDIAPGTTILAFTDGLFERRGESVDVGMERLRSAVRPDRPLAEVLDGLLADLSTGADTDDVAIVGVRW